MDKQPKGTFKQLYSLFSLYLGNSLNQFTSKIFFT